jgi:endonuclease-3 related protein
MTCDDAHTVLRDMYRHLWRAYGPQGWWPAETQTEIVVGAILTQNTAWRNVERAIRRLKEMRCLSWSALRDLSEGELATLIRPAGTYRVKAARLRSFVQTLWERYQGSLDAMLAGTVDEVRGRLLAVRGIGPETADAIMLYAGQHPTFVVDAYTRRVLRRHALIADDADYETVRRLFHAAVTPEAQVYNEYHALLVAVGKHHCQARARCSGCPLEALPHDPHR